jgi:hypothetical protein
VAVKAHKLPGERSLRQFGTSLAWCSLLCDEVIPGIDVFLVSIIKCLRQMAKLN